MIVKIKIISLSLPVSKGSRKYSVYHCNQISLAIFFFIYLCFMFSLVKSVEDSHVKNAVQDKKNIMKHVLLYY